MKTAVASLYINDFSPEIRDICVPLQRRWAEKIRADYHLITEPKLNLGWPTLEKFQVFDFFEEYEYVYFLDVDAMIRPDAWDFQQNVAPHTVLFWGYDFANRWYRDDYFLRDGRMVSACTWCVGCPRSCRDLWTIPTDLSLQEMISRIHPILGELCSVVHTQPVSLIDDYILSRNIAKYGLKVARLTDLFNRIGHGKIDYFFHEYTISREEKITKMQEVLKKWGIEITKD